MMRFRNLFFVEIFLSVWLSHIRLCEARRRVFARREAPKQSRLFLKKSAWIASALRASQRRCHAPRKDESLTTGHPRKFYAKNTKTLITRLWFN